MSRKYMIADRYFNVLSYMANRSNEMIRASVIGNAVGVPNTQVGVLMDRMKSRGWLVSTLRVPPEKVESPVPYYFVSTLGMLAWKYGEAERMWHEEKK